MLAVRLKGHVQSKISALFFCTHIIFRFSDVTDLYLCIHIFKLLSISNWSLSKFSAPGQMEVVCMCLDEVCTLLSCDTTAVVKMAFEIMIDY